MQGQDGPGDRGGGGVEHADRDAGAAVDRGDRVDYGYVLLPLGGYDANGVQARKI